MTATKNKISPKVVLLFLAILFIAPMIAAWSLYSDKNFLPVTLNHGALVNPPLVIQDLPIMNGKLEEAKWQPLLGKWLFIYVNTGPCDKACQEHIYFMRQIRTALGKDMDRVARIYITTPNQINQNLLQFLAKGYQDMQLFAVTQQNLNQFLQPLQKKNLVANDGNIYIVDPLGNLMMVYKTSENPEDMQADLQRLLSVSQIG